jgi:glucose/arabinose dehydrogenase
MRRWCTLLLLALWPGLAAAADVTANVDGVKITTVTVAKGFDSPLFLTSPPGDKRLFVVEQTGTIRIVKDGAIVAKPFLDIRDLVSKGGERGLLGLAFHPDYAMNGQFFVDYTDVAGDTQIVAYQVSPDPDVALPASAKTLISVDQPYENHNGGWLGFGPDKYLYVAMGDGGGSGDPQQNGQNRDVLLGKILRIDVDSGTPYAIPPGNPFAKGGGAPEIFLYGVRNPWRPSFDGDNLYVADVGQDMFEEVDVVTTSDAGANLGWRTMEGMHCFRPTKDCDQTNLVLPVYEYTHHNGCSITGGYVYRGKAIPELAGRYFFGDYCSGVVMSFRYADGHAGDVVDLGGQMGSVGQLTSFGVDGDGELYLVLADGTIEKLVRAP